MRNDWRLIALASVLAAGLACNQSTPPPGDASAPAGTAAAPGGAAPASGGSSIGNAPGAAAAAPAASPAPVVNMMPMDVAAGTPLELKLETPVASDTSRVEDTVRATVAEPVVVAGMTVIPEGAVVTGVVVEADRSARVKGRAMIAIRFHQVVVADTPYKIRTATIIRRAEATKGEDAKKIGIGAGVGTAIGAIAGGKKGAAIGAGIGGGAGTGAVLATRGNEVGIPAGTRVRTTIEDTVRITAPM
jgi:hypothetical protein